MTFTLIGRIPSKKNSKRIFRTGGRMIIASSSAYATWHTEAGKQLLSQKPKQPLEGDISLTMHLYLKGRLDQDLDNAVASILDLFQDAGIIANDKHVTQLHLYKHRGNPDFSAEIEVCQTP